MCFCWIFATILSKETAEFGSRRLLNTKFTHSVQGKHNHSRGILFLLSSLVAWAWGITCDKSKQSWGYSKLRLVVYQDIS